MCCTKKPLALFKNLLIFIFSTGIFYVQNGKAQSAPEYEEVSIFLNVQRIGGIEVPALINGQTAYLPISDIFDFLRIKNAVSIKIDSVSGTFITPQSRFLIDKPHNRIVYMDKVYELKPEDLISTSTNLYLRSDYFGKVFGLNCIFSFRNLSVILSTELELPLVREMRQEQMRANVNKLKGEVVADTIVGRTYPLLHFGMADYSVVTTASNQGRAVDTRVSLGLGGVIAGGETNVILNYHHAEPFSSRQQYYLWRLANNDHHFVKQISAGKIQGQSISSIYAPLVGIQVTNTPTTYRRSFGSYTLSNYTEPNWIAELYVNGVLINYVKADASGFYSFNVPLVYGNSLVKLRFYGPYGEERFSEQNISIPFNFLPKNEFEYTATAGIVEDDERSHFSRFTGNYGLTKSITIGAGAEYLSSLTSKTAIPFMTTSVRLLANLLFSAEYDHQVRSKAVLSYNLPSGLQLEVNNTWYRKGQTAISNTYLEDRKAIISFPFKARSFSGYARATLEQIILPNTKYTTAEWLLSVTLGNFNTSVNTYSLFIDKASPYVYSNFSVSARVLKNILLTQQLQYEYMEKKVVGVKTELEKRLFRNGYVNISYEKNFSSKINNTEIGIRYDFSFAQTRTSVRKSNQLTTYLQSVNGSLIYHGKSKFTNFNNHTSVGKGAVILLPFLDLNGNGRRDADEPKALGLKARLNGGRIVHSIKDTTIQITDLEAYATYLIELDPTGLDIVAWQLRKKNYSVAIDPNFVKRIAVPITVSGQVSGRVMLNHPDEDKGMGRMLICFYNEKSVMIARTASETDGYFTYLGLLPGVYSARIDTVQLNKLHLIAAPASLPFTIVRNNEGSVVDGLTFVVTSAEKHTLVKTPLVQHTKISAPAATKIMEIAVIAGSITIQAAHFKNKNALAARAFLAAYYERVILVPAGGGYFNVRITGIKGANEARTIIKKLKHIGYPGAYILTDP